MKTPWRRSWTCPRCGHRFVSANVWHSCGRHRLADHFRGKDPAVRRLFDRFKGLVRRHGPVTDHRTFRRVETVAPRSHVHYFRLQEPGDLDPGLRRDRQGRRRRRTAGAPAHNTPRPMMTSSRPASRYPSKRDAWIEILIWFGIGALGLAAFQSWRAPESFVAKLATVAFALVAGSFMLWVLYGTHYTVSDERLTIRAGPFRWRIALDAIHSVEPSRSPLSSPAVSLDRLRVRYGPPRRSVLISPDDKERFLWDLAARTPGLVLLGDRLVRK